MIHLQKNPPKIFFKPWGREVSVRVQVTRFTSVALQFQNFFPQILLRPCRDGNYNWVCCCCANFLAHGSLSGLNVETAMFASVGLGYKTTSLMKSLDVVIMNVSTACSVASPLLLVVS